MASDTKTPQASSNSELRKRLFILERALARRSEDLLAHEVLRDMVLTDRELVLQEVIEPLALDDTGGTTTNSEEDALTPSGVSLDLGGGALTGYSYSGDGLDLNDTGCEDEKTSSDSNSDSYNHSNINESEPSSECFSGIPVKLLLKSQSVDLEEMGNGDTSLNNYFTDSGQNDLYDLENFSEYADLFEEDSQTKDYTVTGMGLEFDAGGMKLGVVNFSRLPDRKKKSFFGNSSVGPYKLNATNIVPGSEKVMKDGVELARGANYDFSYTKGEISFKQEIAQNERVLIEYETTGEKSGGPGKFIGFRLESSDIETISDENSLAANNLSSESVREESESSNEINDIGNDGSSDNDIPDKGVISWGPLSIEKWGVSYLSDTLISYQRNGSDIKRSERDQSLMGLDGRVAIFKHTTIDFEAASSEGSRTATDGRFARKVFTIADTRATDNNPLGPYYLDESQLPIIEDSDEVRVNGEILERGSDYTIDLEYGQIRIKNEMLDLTSLDEIEVKYRYLNENDALSGSLKNDSGMAGLVKMENIFGDFKHTYSIDRRASQFMMIGGRPGNQLKNEDRDIAWSHNGLNLGWGNSSSESLQDASTGLTTTQVSNRLSAAYETGPLSISYDNVNNDSYDNRPVHEQDSTKENSAIKFSYKISQNYHFNYDEQQTSGTDLRSNRGNSLTASTQRNYSIDAEPFDGLTFKFKTGSGNQNNTSGETTRTSDKTNRNISLQYKPGRRWQFSYDSADNENTNATITSDPSASTATETSSTGNSEAKWNIRYSPSSATTVSYRLSSRNADQVNGSTTRRQTSWDIRKKLTEETTFQYRTSSLNSGRTNSEQTTKLDNFKIKTQLSWFSGTDVTFKHSTQNSGFFRPPTATGTPAMNTNSSATSNGIKLSCTPLWEERVVSFDYTTKNTSQTSSTTAPSTSGDVRIKTAIEIPFTGDSYFSLKRDKQQKSGTRPTTRTTNSISISGQPISGAELQLTYESEIFNDPENPASSRSESDFNLVIKSTREW